MRYDTAHGHLHVHENWKAEGEAITSVEDTDDPGPPYNDAFTYAEQDLKTNWKTYRRNVEGEVDHDG